MGQIFFTASVVFLDGDRVLTVRKRGTDRFMLPGGKIEPDESPLDCALREAAEEIGVVVRPDQVERLGHWRCAAANEPGALVDSVVHLSHTPVDPTPLAEIAEIAWVSLNSTRTDLAPLLHDFVLPAVRARLADDGR